MNYNWLDREGNVGHCRSPTGGEIEEEERGQRIFSAQKIPFRQRKFRKGSLVFRTEAGVKRCSDIHIYIYIYMHLYMYVYIHMFM